MIRWHDGAETWGDANYLTRAYVEATGVAPTSGGRVTPGVRYHSMNGGRLKTPSIGSANNWTMGFGLRVPGTGAVKIRIFAGAVEQCRLEIENDGSGKPRWKLIRGSTTIDTSSSFELDQWYYFEFQLDVLGAAAAYELRQNENNIMSGTGANLADSGSDGADAFGVETPSGTATRFDDWYILDDDNSDGAGKTDFLGDSVMFEATPNANGHQQDFTRSTGSSNVANVDDPSTAASSSDYNYSDTNGQEDYYGFTDLPVSGIGTIHSIKVTASLAMAGTGLRTVQYRYYNGSTEFDVGSAVAVLGTAVYEQPIFSSINPDTTSAWTKTDLDAAEFGVEVVS